MGFFNFGNKLKPKDVAKDRLRLILIHDRGDLPEETLEKMRDEILEVLSKYIEIESEEVEIALNKGDFGEGETVGTSLVANIPIRNIKGRY